MHRCASKLGTSLVMTGAIENNFAREVQFSKDWAFVPISVQDIILTQYLLLDRPDCLDGNGGALSMFGLLPLSKDDAENVFGITESFMDALPIVEDIPENHMHEMACAFETLVGFSESQDENIDLDLERMFQDAQQCPENELADNLNALVTESKKQSHTRYSLSGSE